MKSAERGAAGWDEQLGKLSWNATRRIGRIASKRTRMSWARHTMHEILSSFCVVESIAHQPALTNPRKPFWAACLLYFRFQGRESMSSRKAILGS
jgi:hypothetical protein